MPSTSTGQPEVSIVLTTYNSEKTIPHVLQALVSQDYNLGKAELIIVDGNSRDSTVRILRDFLSQYGNKFSRSELILHDRNYGVSRARNDGIRASRGRYILILDHDVVMQKDTLTVLVKHLQSAPRRVAAVVPLHKPPCGSRLALWEYRIRRGRITKINAITSCALVRREVVEEIGLYDETLGPPFTIYEDIEYGARALAKGYEIHVLGTHEVIHNTCNDAPQAGERSSQPNYLKPLRALRDPRYRYALRRYLSSAPLGERARWYLYTSLVSTSAPALLATPFLGAVAFMPWLLVAAGAYIDVVRQYWNIRTPHISLAYSLVSYVWRLMRSTMLLIP